MRGRPGEDGADRRLSRPCSSAWWTRSRPRRTSRPTGHFKKAGVPPTRVRREVQAGRGRRRARRRATRSSASMFADGERVDVIGTSRGKGFQGVVKRHHFARRRGDPRLDVPSRARLDRRLVVPVACRQGHAHRRAAWATTGRRCATSRSLRVDPDNNLLHRRGRRARRADRRTCSSARRVTAKTIKVAAGREAKKKAQEVAMQLDVVNSSNRRSARSTLSDDVFGGRVERPT